MATSGTAMILGADSLQAGALDAGGDMSLSIANGATLTGTTTSGGNLSASFGTLDFTSLDASGSIGLEGTDLSGNGITAGTSLTVLLGGSYAVDIASAGTALALQAASASGTSLAAIGNLDATVDGLASVDGYRAGGDLTVTAGSLNATTISADGLISGNVTGEATLGSNSAGTSLGFTAASLSASSLESAGDLTLTVTDTAALGTVTSTAGSVFIDPALLTFDAISADQGITLAGGRITGGTLDAGTSIEVSASDALTLDSVSAGSALALRAANIRAGSLDSGGATSLMSGDLADITGAINAGLGISITAGRLTTPAIQSLNGNVTLAIAGRADLTSVAVLGGDLTIDAGTLRFTSASASESIRLRGGDIAGDAVSSGGASIIGATSVVNIRTVSAGASVTINGPMIDVSEVVAGSFTDLDGGTINVGETSAGTTAFVDAQDFTFSKLSAGDSVELLAVGGVTGGVIEAGSTLTISARGSVTLDDANSGGAIAIEARSLDALSLTGGGNLSLVATDAINLGTVKVLGSFELSGASLILGTSSSGLDSNLTVTGNATIGSISAGLADTGQNLFQVVVQALANSYGGGSLIPVFEVVQGQTITVSSSTDDLWSAGALPRFSDGNGLVALRVATAQDDSGVQPGVQIGAAFGNLTIGNFSAPFGALVGQIGDQNVLLGANGSVTSPATGTLSVGYWDSNAGDNTGSIAFSFGNGTGGGSASNPANINITTGGNLTVGAATASSGITLDAGGTLTIDTADAGTSLALAGDMVDAGTLTAGTHINLSSRGKSVIGTATAGGRFTADVGGLDFTSIDAADAVDIASLAGVNGGDIKSGASIVVDASGGIAIRDATAATDLALASGTTSDLSARTLAAGGAIGVEGRDVSFSGATAGGDFSANVRSLAAPAVSAGGTFSVSGTGAVQLGTASAGSALNVTSQTLTFSRMSSGGALRITTGGDVSGGDLVATGSMRISSGPGKFVYGSLEGGDIAIVSGSVTGGGILARAGDLNLTAAGDASLGAITANGNVAIDTQSLAFSTITAGRSFSTSNRTMNGTSIAAGQDVDISSSGDVTLSGLVGASARVNSAGIVNITGLRLSDAISVSADAVVLDALGNLAIQRISADGGNVGISAEGSITGGSIDALGDINLLARNGDVVIDSLSAGYSDVFGGSVRPRATVASGVIGQGNIDIVASGDVEVNDVADAAKAFTVNAGDTIRINDLATGATMDLTSSDIQIGAAGQLGETEHTDAITLRNTGQGPLRLGDNIPSTASGYAISQAEFSRIRSRGELAISASQALLVGDLAVTAQSGTAQGQIGETGTLTLSSGGLASFLGALSMSNAAGNSLAVNSESGLFLDAASGSIRLLDGEARGGTLAISGTGIAMVTRDALEDISQLTDSALVTDRLGLNDGVVDGRTLIEADTVRLRSDREVYIQNTSASTRLDDRRGLVANTLRIGSRDGGQLDIVINGIVSGQTGVDAIEQITFEEAFTDLSTVNGCVIVSSNTCNKLPFEIIELRDLVEEVLKEDPGETALQVVDSFTKTTLIQLNQIAPAGFEPLIDEPVTGTGNDDILGEGKQVGE